MRWGGPLILLFVVYHLLDLTVGRANPGFVAGDVYRNVVASFQRPLVAGFYIATMLALALHLRHGVWSMLQTLGASHPRYDAWRKSAATAFAIVVCGGFVLVPLAILAGFVK
jgi:succinate dehydrogenase / fumarate reductase cytochrome b subunit